MDIIDAIRLVDIDPDLLKNDKRMADLRLSTAELAMLRKLDPDTIRALVEGIEQKIHQQGIASSQACTGGTQACVDLKPAMLNPAQLGAVTKNR